MSFRWMGLLATGAGLVLTTVWTGSAQAQSCVPLQVVGGNGTQVEKSVSPPPTGVTRSNWDTDFLIPQGAVFNSFVATLIPKNSGDYDIQMNLKYPNDTSGQAFSRNAFNLTQNQPFRISGAPRTDSQPYQVNIVVGGLAVLGNTYTLSVAGCQ